MESRDGGGGKEEEAGKVHTFPHTQKEEGEEMATMGDSSDLCCQKLHNHLRR